MREIKFRYYDKREKNFRYFDLTNMKIDRNLEKRLPFLREWLWRNSIYGGASDIQQFTGLKDRKNKEVFENDIVAFKEITTFDRTNEWVAGFGIVKFGEYECSFDEYSSSV